MFQLGLYLSTPPFCSGCWRCSCDFRQSRDLQSQQEFWASPKRKIFGMEILDVEVNLRAWRNCGSRRGSVVQHIYASPEQCLDVNLKMSVTSSSLNWWNGSPSKMLVNWSSLICSCWGDIYIPPTPCSGWGRHWHALQRAVYKMSEHFLKKESTNRPTGRGSWIYEVMVWSLRDVD